MTQHPFQKRLVFITLLTGIILSGCLGNSTGTWSASGEGGSVTASPAGTNAEGEEDSLATTAGPVPDPAGLPPSEGPGGPVVASGDGVMGAKVDYEEANPHLYKVLGWYLFRDATERLDPKAEEPLPVGASTEGRLNLLVQAEGINAEGRTRLIDPVGGQVRLICEDGNGGEKVVRYVDAKVGVRGRNEDFDVTFMQSPPPGSNCLIYIRDPRKELPPFPSPLSVGKTDDYSEEVRIVAEIGGLDRFLADSATHFLGPVRLAAPSPFSAGGNTADVTGRGVISEGPADTRPPPTTSPPSQTPRPRASGGR